MSGSLRRGARTAPSGGGWPNGPELGAAEALHAAALRMKTSFVERQVLELLTKGLTNRRIADSLCITEKTVSVHVKHILEKAPGDRPKRSRRDSPWAAAKPR